ncbi:MAG TPA: hypothetical protein EYP56_00840 [Planctomycetaceae bacterium]|nr:hypothetical protein [Planctomycetaceae bacterium]HIQ20981.1 hypothetical protein [Planctomycetota bacterium]
MRGWIKWLLVAGVMAAALMVAAPREAQARRVVVRTYYPYSCYYSTYVYRYPRRVYYYYPAPVVVYRRPVFLGPPLPPPLPPPPPFFGYYVW